MREREQREVSSLPPAQPDGIDGREEEKIGTEEWRGYKYQSDAFA